MDVEIVDCAFADKPDDAASGMGPVCWAKIVWLDRRSVANAASVLLLGKWVARKQNPGSECPWIHNKLYRIGVPGGATFIDVKVGDFRETRDATLLNSR